jgi:type IV pilus assembly protein PilM
LLFFGRGSIVTGLDVGTTSVKAATLSHQGGAAQLVGLAAAEIPESEDRAAATTKAIQAALAGSGAGKNTPIVSAVGGSGISVKHVTFPEMPKQALAESIRWEARKHVPFEGSDFVLDFQPLDGANSDDGGELQVLLAAVETKLLDSHVEMLAAAGVEPDAVDLIPLALINEVEEEGLLDSQALAVIDLGVKSITMAVYRRGGLFFARSIPLVGKTAAARAANGEDKTAGDESWFKTVLREVRRSLTFYHNETSKQGIDKIYLTGGRALEPGIDAMMRKDLGIPTEVLNPLAKVPITGVNIESLKSEGPRFAVAIGLARRS